jgi:hypothetical protein
VANVRDLVPGRLLVTGTVGGRSTIIYFMLDF